MSKTTLLSLLSQPETYPDETLPLAVDSDLADPHSGKDLWLAVQDNFEEQLSADVTLSG